MSQRSKLKAKLVKLEAALLIAEETYTKLLATDHESYKFDSGDGSQQVKRRSLSELKDQIDELEAEICSIESRLRGSGVVSISLRRNQRCRY